MAGQIVKRGDNKWLVRVFVGRDSLGKREYISKIINGTKKDAQKYLNTKLLEKDTGALTKPADTYLNDYLNRWLTDIAQPRVRPNTFESYKWILDAYIRPAIGSRKITNIPAQEIQRIYGDMLARGLSSRTVRYAHVVLSSAFKQAVRWQMVKQNPCELCELPKKQRKEMMYFTLDEANTFLEHASTDRLFALFLLAIECGLRPEEYLALQWKDIDLNKGMIQVRRVIKFLKGGGFAFDEPKTKTGRRSMHVSDRLTEQLAIKRRQQLEEKMAFGPNYQDHGLVFANTAGMPIDLGNVRNRHFKKIRDAAGLPKIRLYDLRHTCATIMLQKGIHPKVVSERLGHEGSVITLDIYSHVLPSMQKDATDIMAKALGGK
jgi:integrase